MIPEKVKAYFTKDAGRNRVIDDRINQLRTDPDITNLRKHQQQVDVTGNKVGEQ